MRNSKILKEIYPIVELRCDTYFYFVKFCESGNVYTDGKKACVCDAHMYDQVMPDEFGTVTLRRDDNVAW